jgi:3-oxoacyl-[acyl-carrier protein] reductase
MTQDSLLAGRAALVTGAARGLDLAIARTLAESGAAIVISDLDSEELERARAALDAEDLRVRAVVGNVAVADSEAMVRSAVGNFGRLDILVNNAGGSAYTPTRLEDVTEDDYDRVMDWNVRGTFFCTKAALPALGERGSSIVNLASMSGRAGLPLFSPQYSAAKGAIVALTRNLSQHLGDRGIRVNAVAPGFVEAAERANSVWDSRDNTIILERIPLGRRGESSELADAVLFLASDQSRYITGCVIDVNGGYLTA